MVRLQASGSASSTFSRCSSGSCTEPPVDSCTTRSVCSAQGRDGVGEPAEVEVGLCSSSRMCTWIIAAPAAWQRWAVSTSSSSVVGSCGQSALAVSAPVGATVISSLSLVMGVMLSDRLPHPGSPGARSDPASPVGLREGRRRGRRGLRRARTGVLLGVTHDDGREQVGWMARKIWGLRILRDEQSASDIGAPILVVSQFTLYGDPRKGRRPTWNAAAPGRCRSRSTSSARRSRRSAPRCRAAASERTCRSSWSTTGR